MPPGLGTYHQGLQNLTLLFGAISQDREIEAIHALAFWAGKSGWVGVPMRSRFVPIVGDHQCYLCYPEPRSRPLLYNHVYSIKARNQGASPRIQEGQNKNTTNLRFFG